MTMAFKGDGLQYLFFITVLLGGNLLLHSFGRVRKLKYQLIAKNTIECVTLDIASKKKNSKEERECVSLFQAMPQRKQLYLNLIFPLGAQKPFKLPLPILNNGEI